MENSSEIYEFEMRCKPGRENIVTDMLSPLFEEHGVNENPEDDYFDVLIAAIQQEPSRKDEDALLNHQYLETKLCCPVQAKCVKKQLKIKSKTKILSGSKT